MASLRELTGGEATRLSGDVQAGVAITCLGIRQNFGNRSFSTCWLSMELTLSLDTVVVSFPVAVGSCHCGICGVVE